MASPGTVTTFDRIVIVPRWSGRAGFDWYPWIRAELHEDPGPDLRVDIVELPNPDAPVIDACVAALQSAFGDHPDALGSTLLVGHSVGCQALLRYLAALPPSGAGDSTRARLLCVAGWWAIDGPWPSIQPWIDTPIALAQVRAQVDRVSVLLSDNDPFTADWRANQAMWEQRLGAEVEVVPGGRHFNAAKEPAVLERVRRLL